jgi:hypothetical protein
MGPGFASPGVAVKQVARNAIAEAIAFIEAVFMLLSNDKAVPPFNMKNFACGCDYKKIHTGSVVWSQNHSQLLPPLYPGTRRSAICSPAPSSLPRALQRNKPNNSSSQGSMPSSRNWISNSTKAWTSAVADSRGRAAKQISCAHWTSRFEA